MKAQGQALAAQMLAGMVDDLILYELTAFRLPAATTAMTIVIPTIKRVVSSHDLTS